MAFSLFGHTILSNSELADLKSFALTEEEKAVALLKSTPLGKTVANAITAAEGASTLSGPAKFEQVLASTLPSLQTLLTKAGFQAEVASLEDIGRQFVQTVFNDVKSTTAGTWATNILTALGVKI